MEFVVHPPLLAVVRVQRRTEDSGNLNPLIRKHLLGEDDSFYADDDVLDEWED